MTKDRREHRISVDNGKYVFVQRGGFKLDILRHGEPWVEDITASKAIGSMMYELDAGRVVLEAARQMVAAETANGRGDSVKALARALATHDVCVGPQQPAPTEWARSYCLCAGGDDGGHDVDCDRS